MTDIYIPSFDQFMNPVIQALYELGGSGHIEEINAKVIELSKVSDEQLSVNWPYPDKVECKVLRS